MRIFKWLWEHYYSIWIKVVLFIHIGIEASQRERLRPLCSAFYQTTCWQLPRRSYYQRGSAPASWYLMGLLFSNLWELHLSAGSDESFFFFHFFCHLSMYNVCELVQAQVVRFNSLLVAVVVLIDIRLVWALCLCQPVLMRSYCFHFCHFCLHIVF